MNRNPTARELALTDLSTTDLFAIVSPLMARYRLTAARDLARRLRALPLALALGSALVSGALAQPARLGPAGPPEDQPTAAVKPRRPATPGVNSACKADYQAHCSGSDIAGAARDACLRQNWVNLSSTCRASLQQHKSSEPLDDDEP